MSGNHRSVISEFNWLKSGSTRWFGNRECGIAIEEALERAESCWELTVVKRNHGVKTERKMYYVGTSLPKTVHGHGNHHGCRMLVDRGVHCHREKGE